MNPDNIVWHTAILIIPVVIAIVFHEVAHGWVAKWLGDPTAAERRRLSFNPIRHVDPVGTLILPLGLAVVGAPVFGWAKPVPVIASRLRNPRYGMIAVALAGPGMNLLLALAAAIGLGALSAATAPQFGPPTGLHGFVVASLASFLLVNVFLALVIGLIVVMPMLVPGADIVGAIVVPPARAVVGWFLGLAALIG